MNKSVNNLTKNNSTNSTKIGNIFKSNNSTVQQNIRNTPITTGYSGSNVFGIILFIIVIIVVGGASYWFYNYYTNTNFQSHIDSELITDIKDATNTITLASSSIPSSSFSNEYAISFWINVQDYNYNYGTEKVILSRGTTGSGNPEIVLGAKSNDLIVRVKLQGANIINANVSNFEDIPIQLKSQNVGMGYIQPENLTNQSTEQSFIMADTFNNLGSNSIDFPTIKYINDNTDIDTSECGYFDLISGNTINTNKNNQTKSSYNGNRIVEGFTPIDDVVNASVAVIVDICNIANSIQSQKFADSSVDNINSSFQSLIDALEKTRTTAKTGADIEKVFTSFLDSSPTQASTSTKLLSTQFTQLEKDFATLATFSTVQVDYKTLFTAINTKMSSISCPLIFDGESEVDGTISVYENIIKLIKNSLLTYIKNMGTSINNKNPELSSSLTASCIIDNNINKDPTIGTCIVKMIPLQKWVNVIVSVYNQIIDIYIDGQLSSSCVLKGFPAISTDAVNITPDGGFSGKITRVLFTNTAMTISRAKQIYYSGPVVTTSIFSMIPNWAYWGAIIIIIISIGYSTIM